MPIKMPKAVLLFGPPGCGKTSLMRCVGMACGCEVISVRGPELLNKYIGSVILMCIDSDVCIEMCNVMM